MSTSLRRLMGTRICVYCHKIGTSREHVWPQWIRRHAESVMGLQLANVQGYQGAEEHKLSPPKLTFFRKGHSRLSLTIGHPCAPCNSGWMSKLEVDVAPILTPMIEGKTRLLSYEDARVLQAWATKTALNFSYAAESTFQHPMPRRLARDLYAGRVTRTPVEDVQVWIDR